jgi:hypothetical protein
MRRTSLRHLFGRVGGLRKRLILAAAVLACLLAGLELAMRVTLFAAVRLTGRDGIPVLHKEAAPSFVYFSQMPWAYDRALGYDYQPGARFLIGSINDGRFSGCTGVPHVNEDGTMGLQTASYASSRLKIVLVGDETAAQLPDWSGPTWPNILQEKLQERLRQKVAVLNYARDGYALPQILLMAAKQAAEQKPDIVVIAFTTATLGRSMTWRSVGDIGGYPTALAASTPDVLRQPQLGWPLGTVVSAKVTPEWCKSLSIAVQSRYEVAVRTDRVTSDLINQHDALQAFAGGSVPVQFEWFTRRSFLVDWVRTGHPLYRKELTVTRPNISGYPYDDYAADPQVTQAVDRLRAAAARIILLHVPLYPELKERRAWVEPLSGLPPGRVNHLAQSLSRVFNLPILDMSDYVPYPQEDLLQYVNNPGDYQLRPPGIVFYGDIAARAIAERGSP